jgi:DNA mismatch repair protein MutS
MVVYLMNPTPMMAQYLSIKKDYKDFLLFYRMGDFYELFWEDAICAAPILEVALTQRGKHLEEEIPMCGIPHHALESYSSKLIKKGYRIAICDQVQTPEEAKIQQHKGPLKREVVRIITPGTLMEDGLLPHQSFNFLVAIGPCLNFGKNGEKIISLAWIDVSIGDFFTQTIGIDHIGDILHRLDPVEILIAQSFYDIEAIAPIIYRYNHLCRPYPDGRFQNSNAYHKILNFYGVTTLEAWGDFSIPQLSCASIIIDYLHLTYKKTLPSLKPLKHIEENVYLFIDESSRQNLELTQTQKKEYEGSFLWSIDHTNCVLGARLLRSYLHYPLKNIEKIEKRLSRIDWIIHHYADILDSLCGRLKGFPDINRCLSRIIAQRSNVRDVFTIRQGLRQAQQIYLLLAQHHEALNDCPQPIYHVLIDPLLKQNDALLDKLNACLSESNNSDIFIKEGFFATFDEALYLSNEGNKALDHLQQRYAEQYHIPSLKIRHNNILGHYIEVTKIHAQKVPNDFIHRQTLTTATRYTSQELIDLSKKIYSAQETVEILQQQLFDQLIQDVVVHKEKLEKLARCLARLDVAVSFAVLATKYAYTRPEFCLDTQKLFIDQGRHSVVEKILSFDHYHPLGKKNAQAFCPNNTDLKEKSSIVLLSGPNMAGKSTYLRQNALIVLLGQMGGYVAAKKASFSLKDRIFCRVGASDDLSKGQSTFMTEMIETATILNHATKDSLVILDEIGRGTATYDGLSIAQSCCEFFSKLGCFTLFATHYHELQQLKKTLHNMILLTMAIEQNDEEIKFLHQVKPGYCSHSFGIYVAKMAGFPLSVVQRSYEILKELEKRSTISNS